MKSKEIKSLNELLEKLRLGEIEGIIEIRITNRGKVNKILVKRIDDSENNEKEITHRIIELQQEKPKLQANFSHLNVEADISGFDLHESNFSYSKVLNSELSYTNLDGVAFYKALISQSNIVNAYAVNMNGAYVTGSVNLYNAQPSVPEIVNPLDAPFQAQDHEYRGHY